MTIEEVTPQQYKSIITNPYHIYGSVDFNELNAYKAQKVFYFLFKDTKYRLGLIAAKRDHQLVSPFSAPFGGFSFIHEDVKINAIEEAVDVLEEWCLTNGIKQISYTLPPPIYHESFLAKVANVVYRKSYRITHCEVNFHFDLAKMTDDYMQDIWHNARKNLKIALANELDFLLCDTSEQKNEAYDIIQQNRAIRGKPLRMTWEQVEKTTTVITTDFFLVRDKNDTPVAAAIVFSVTPHVVQVIYWGDLPAYQSLKTMNYLSFKVFDFYKQQGKKFVDIGYSTENSVPNYGLCEFKESLGCDLQPKHTYEKILA